MAQPTMKIGKYVLMYRPKIDRAIDAVGDKDEKALLAEYDRLGGYITLDGEKVKNGSFWDYKEGKARSKPEVVVIKKARAATEKKVEVDLEEEAPKKKKSSKKKSSK